MHLGITEGLACDGVCPPSKYMQFTEVLVRFMPVGWQEGTFLLNYLPHELEPMSCLDFG